MNNIIKQNTSEEKLISGLIYGVFFSMFLVMYFFTDYGRLSPTQSSTTQSSNVTEEREVRFPDYSGAVQRHFQNMGASIILINRISKDRYNGILMVHATGRRLAFGATVNEWGDIIQDEVR